MASWWKKMTADNDDIGISLPRIRTTAIASYLADLLAEVRAGRAPVLRAHPLEPRQLVMIAVIVRELLPRGDVPERVGSESRAHLGIVGMVSRVRTRGVIPYLGVVDYLHRRILPHVYVLEQEPCVVVVDRVFEALAQLGLAPVLEDATADGILPHQRPPLDILGREHPPPRDGRRPHLVRDAEAVGGGGLLRGRRRPLGGGGGLRCVGMMRRARSGACGDHDDDDGVVRSGEEWKSCDEEGVV